MGSGIIHEATEGYAEGVISITNQIDIPAPAKLDAKTQSSIGCDRYGNTPYKITSASWQKVDP